jgi:hypothetical protein
LHGSRIAPGTDRSSRAIARLWSDAREASIGADGGAAARCEPTLGRSMDLPVVGLRYGKIASAIHRDRERVGELAHEGAVGGEVPPCQVAQAPVRSFHYLAAVERS